MRRRGDSPSVLFFATQGSGHGDEHRIESLLSEIDAEAIPFDRSRKLGSLLAVFRILVTRRPRLVVMEGTGIAGGLALICARIFGRIPYVVSSGDAVAPFIGIRHPGIAPIASLYERTLCRLSAGFIGWTPYLVGRALTYGAPRGVTAAGWSPPAEEGTRERIRDQLGIPQDAIVFGLVGHLGWVDRIEYCYGMELVSAIRRTERKDLHVLVVGDGSGLEQLGAIAGGDEGVRVHMPGRVPKERVPEYLSAVDVASLPQSVDGVGSFRYTTKLSEYLASELPMVTSRIPMAYDLDDGWLWRLEGETPWGNRYVSALADLMETVTPEEIELKRKAIPRELTTFDPDRQRRRVTAFLTDLLEDVGV